MARRWPWRYEKRRKGGEREEARGRGEREEARVASEKGRREGGEKTKTNIEYSWSDGSGSGLVVEK